MKKSEKKAIGKNILNGALAFLKGATVSNPAVSMVVGAVDGVVKGVQKTKENNINSETGGVGNVDWNGAVGSIVGGIILIGGGIAVIKGWLTWDDIRELLKLWEKTQ